MNQSQICFKQSQAFDTVTVSFTSEDDENLFSSLALSSTFLASKEMNTWNTQLTDKVEWCQETKTEIIFQKEHCH